MLKIKKTTPTKPITWVVNQDGCFICTSHKPGNKGYPNINVGGKHYRIHRYIYQKEKGKIPEGMCVCHKCDNRSCINPEHLFLGTVADNNQDCINKNRQAKGSQKPQVKLCEKDIPEIRELISRGISLRNIGKRYGVSSHPIFKIAHNREWKHVAARLKEGAK